MHFVTVLPGLPLVTAYRAEPASLSPIVTSPAVMLLPGFCVVLVKAEKTPKAAIAPTAPTTRRLASSFRVLVIRESPIQRLGSALIRSQGSGRSPTRVALGVRTLIWAK